MNKNYKMLYLFYVIKLFKRQVTLTASMSFSKKSLKNLQAGSCFLIIFFKILIPPLLIFYAMLNDNKFFAKKTNPLQLCRIIS